MTADIIPFLTQFEFCYICFYNKEEMERTSAIPLGVMGEIILPKIRGLGLYARTQLAQDELKILGAADRKKLERPFDFLTGELDPIWMKAAPGSTIEFLRHSRKPLDISTTSTKEPPKHLLSGTNSARASAANQYLNEILEGEIQVFLSEPIEPGYAFRPTLRVTASKISVSVT